MYSMDLLSALKKQCHVDCISYGLPGSLRLFDRRKGFFRLFSRYPVAIRTYYSRAAGREIASVLAGGDYNLILIDHFRMFWVVDYLSPEQLAKTCLVTHNVESLSRESGYLLEKRLIYKALLFIDYLKTCYWEKHYVARAPRVSAISEGDAQYLLPRSRAVASLKPGYTGERFFSKPSSSVPSNVVWVGSFNFFAKRLNLIDFCEAMSRRVEGLRFTLHVVGAMSAGLFSELSAKYPFCVFHPNVDSVYPYLLQARCGIIYEPVGGGFKLKSLDYVFTHTPIFALRGSCSGLPLEDGDGIFYADNADDLIDLLNLKIDSFAELDRASEMAFSKCAEVFSWDSIVSGFLHEVGC